MNQISRLSIFAALVAAGTLRIQAAQTNLVQNINLTITAYAEGETVTNGVLVTRPVLKFKRSSKDIVQLRRVFFGRPSTTEPVDLSRYVEDKHIFVERRTRAKVDRVKRQLSQMKGDG